MRKYQTITAGNEKFYKYQANSHYPEYISRLRLPDYCPKCHSREGVYISFDEKGHDILRCGECGYSVIAPVYMAGELGCESVKCIYFKPNNAVVCQRPNRHKAVEIHKQTGQCLEFVRSK